MRRILVLLAFWAGTAQAQEPVLVPVEARVPNRADHGVCWWACAETAGRAQGIVPLQHLVERVVATGRGFRGGAGQEDIDFWMAELKLHPLTNPDGARDKAAVGLVQSWLRRGLPVIVSYRHSAGTHAVLLLRLGEAKETWTSDGGGEVTDYAVDYYDPDGGTVNNVRRSWTWFAAAWTGKAYAFDPKDQDPAYVSAAARPRLLAANYFRPQGPPPPRQVHPPYQAPPPVYVSPEILVNVQHPPVPVHALPYVPAHPVSTPPHIPSNTDINDGVTRPADVFYNYYTYSGYDYNAEYRAWHPEGGK